VKPEKESPLTPPGLGSARAHPGRASLTGTCRGGGVPAATTPERRSLCKRNRVIVATGDWAK
jgi:hypothetical protein